MTFFGKVLSLQAVLVLDALSCIAMGALFIFASGPVAGLTGLPADLLFWVGATLLLPFGLFITVLVRSRRIPDWAYRFVVLGNVGWVIASVMVPVTDIVSPNAMGWIFLLGQAAVVALFAMAEIYARCSVAPRV